MPLHQPDLHFSGRRSIRTHSEDSPADGHSRLNTISSRTVHNQAPRENSKEVTPALEDTAFESRYVRQDQPDKRPETRPASFTRVGAAYSRELASVRSPS